MVGAVLDHIVYAVPDLGAGVEEFTELTGVVPARGGQHVGIGTANYLVGLGADAFLEIIGPDPAQETPTRPRPFGIDGLGEPCVMAWAVRTNDLDAAVDAAKERGYDPGEIAPMSRATPAGETLNWRLTWADVRDGPALVPFLIDWGATPTPPSRGLPEIGLEAFEATHPIPDGVRDALRALDADLPVGAGNRAALVVTLAGPNGRVVLT